MFLRSGCPCDPREASTWLIPTVAPPRRLSRWRFGPTWGASLSIYAIGGKPASDRHGDFDIVLVARAATARTADRCLAIFLLSIGCDLMPNHIALGISGLEAEPGDHICGALFMHRRVWG
jgi:hypothetical protein